MTNTETTSWKEKYFSTLETLEVLENKNKERERTETILRQAMSRLSLAVETKDPQLNAELEALRKTVRAGSDIQRIQQSMEEISASILRLDQRQTSADSIAATLERLEHRSERTQLPNDIRQATRELKKQLRQASKQADPRAALDAYASYADSLIDWVATEAGDESPGLLGRLFGRKDDTPGAEEPPVGASETITPPQSGEPLEQTAATETPPVGEEGIQATAGETHAPDLPATLSFNQVLFDLLNRLDLPATFSTRAQRLGARLHQPPTAALATAAVTEIADLVARSRHQVEQEKQEIEQFLSQLTGRLQELDHLLGDSLGNREHANAQGNAIDASMSAEVEQIQRSVAEARDFDGLKTSIRTHLENIQEQMQARKELEQTQLKMAEAEAAHLRESLAKVEGESQELRARLKDARDRALRDALTGLANRLAYDERIGQEIARWIRYGHPTVLSIWDIDHFKKINDTFGHTAGDNALKAVAKLLEEATRDSDFLARFGGEEFMLLLPETDIATALELANRLRERVAAKRFQYRGQPVPLSISCGLAHFIDQDTAEDVYRRADVALYRAKAAGRNCCKVFEPGMLDQD